MDKPKRGYGYIYKYTSPSGKSYIGQTVQSLSSRAGHNGKNYSGCKYFYAAIKKYGWENFIVEILGEFPAEQLNFRERYYIEAYNTLVPNGYNIQLHELVDYHKGRKKIYQYDSNGELIRSWDGQSIAADSLGLNRQSLNACLKGKSKSCGNYYWSFQLLEKYPITEKISNEEKVVFMYDVNGNVIKKFPSITKAAEYVKGERSPIKKCCRGELKMAYGYKWSCTEVLKEKKYNNTPISVNQVDITTNKIIQTFPSISAAARAMNVSGTSIIRRALDSCYTAYGYKWQRAQSSTTKNS